MFDNIESMEAFKQKTDFCGGNITKIVRRGSDIDFSYELANGRMAAIEEKKDTWDHSVENFIMKDKQWEHYRKLCRDDTYLIYVTHDRNISDKEDIPLDALTVRYLEVNKQEIKLERAFKLDELVNYLGSLNTYYIKVRYKNGQIEYALKHPIDERWSGIDYFAASICFLTEEYARNYINTRYQKDFNQEYIYEIWYIDEDGNHNKVDEVKYQQSEMLVC